MLVPKAFKNRKRSISYILASITKFTILLSLLLYFGGCGGGSYGTNSGNESIQTVLGFVVDSNGEPVSDVNVYGEKTGDMDTTGVDGSFTIKEETTNDGQTLAVILEKEDLSDQVSFPTPSQGELVMFLLDKKSGEVGLIGTIRSSDLVPAKKQPQASTPSNPEGNKNQTNNNNSNNNSSENKKKNKNNSNNEEECVSLTPGLCGDPEVIQTYGQAEEGQTPNSGQWVEPKQGSEKENKNNLNITESAIEPEQEGGPASEGNEDPSSKGVQDYTPPENNDPISNDPPEGDGDGESNNENPGDPSQSNQGQGGDQNGAGPGGFSF